MKTRIRALHVAAALLFVCCAAGCRPRVRFEGTTEGPTRLCGGFQSYQTPQEVRKILNQSGFSGRWTEETTFNDPSDKRPPHRFLHISGPFKLSGVEGKLKLTFYNDRLMVAEFSTNHGREYLDAIFKQGGKVPEAARKQVRVDRRTEFRYDADNDGTFRFEWSDPKLDAEWMEWVKEYS